MKKFSTNNEKETKAWASSYAQSLKGGEIIGLIGDLGAGKTTFTQGLAEGLGVAQNVNSPTFVIMKIYPITNSKSNLKTLVHIDAYRLESIKDLEAIGATEYFEREDTVVLIEWADIIKKTLPKKTKFIEIKASGNKRQFSV